MHAKTRTRSAHALFGIAPALVALAILAGGILSASAAPPPSPSGGAVVDINNASLEELDALPGIGPALAQRIVDHRREHGPFKTVDDLLAVKGVGPKMLAKIRDRLTAGQPKAGK